MLTSLIRTARTAINAAAPILTLLGQPPVPTDDDEIVRALLATLIRYGTREIGTDPAELKRYLNELLDLAIAERDEP